MHPISTERFAELLAPHEAPCISLYQPTHRHFPDNSQDPIRFGNLLKQLESTLREKYDAEFVRATLEPFEQLSRDTNFWNHRTEGLAVFSAPGKFEVIEVQRPVQELLIVADSFHTKPLIRILQSADRFQVLCLTRDTAQLYEGNRDALQSVEMPEVMTDQSELDVNERSPGTQNVRAYGNPSNPGGTAIHHGHQPRTDLGDAEMLRFFRKVAEGVLEHHSRATELPLLLVALPETQQEFRRISDNPFLLEEGIQVDPGSFDLDSLREAAWKAIEPQYLARLEQLTENFNTALAQRKGSGDLSDVAKAAVADKVGTLLVEADRLIPGVLDRSTGDIRRAGPEDSHVDDLLDDLAELVLSKRGKVIIVPQERMPGQSGLAAIYRY